MLNNMISYITRKRFFCGFPTTCIEYFIIIETGIWLWKYWYRGLVSLSKSLNVFDEHMSFIVERKVDKPHGSYIIDGNSEIGVQVLS